MRCTFCSLLKAILFCVGFATALQATARRERAAFAIDMVHRCQHTQRTQMNGARQQKLCTGLQTSLSMMALSRTRRTPCDRWTASGSLTPQADRRIC